MMIIVVMIMAERVSVGLIVLTSIREVLGSYLGQDITYPD
jgi:hypothetical protein